MNYDVIKYYVDDVKKYDVMNSEFMTSSNIMTSPSDLILSDQSEQSLVANKPGNRRKKLNERDRHF